MSTLAATNEAIFEGNVKMADILLFMAFALALIVFVIQGYKKAAVETLCMTLAFALFFLASLIL